MATHLKGILASEDVDVEERVGAEAICDYLFRIEVEWMGFPDTNPSRCLSAAEACIKAYQESGYIENQ